jgi:hypothetical protein
MLQERQGDAMKRREVIALVGAGMWLLAAFGGSSDCHSPWSPSSC